MATRDLTGLLHRPWAMEAQAARAFMERVLAAEVPVVQAGLGERDAVAGYEIRDGVAVLELVGPMLKETPWWFELVGIAATDSTAMAAAVRAAAADEAVQRIVLYVDSPGGEVAGTQELADAVYAARQSKRVDAFVSDWGMSAAYYVASQATTLYANEPGAVGSIGTYTVLWDESGAAAQAGVKVHVISSGPLKGAGEPGTEVPAALLAEYQGLIDEMAGQFVRAVARGRGMREDQVRELATGGVWMATAAVGLGLIDGINTFEGVLAGVGGAARSSTEEIEMADEQTKIETVEALRAQYGELVQAACDASAADRAASERERLIALRAAIEGREGFVIDCYLAGDDVTAAKAKLADVLTAEAAERAAAAAAPVRQVITDREPTQAELEAMAAAEPKTYAEAKAKVAAEHPEASTREVARIINERWPGLCAVPSQRRGA